MSQLLVMLLLLLLLQLWQYVMLLKYLHQLCVLLQLLLLLLQWMKLQMMWNCPWSSSVLCRDFVAISSFVFTQGSDLKYLEI